MDFGALVAQSASATPSAADAKRGLPITWVLHSYGIAVEVSEDGRAHCPCPFHADSAPSFDVFGPEFERWGCFPCGDSGDALDLIQRLDPQVRGFSAACAKAVEMRQAMADTNWNGPRRSVSHTFDVAAAAARVETAHRAAAALSDSGGEAMSAFVAARGYPFSRRWLAQEFDVGADGPHVVIPHYDGNTELCGYKYRTAGGRAVAAPGSKFSELYGHWRRSPGVFDLPVLLCEGESDTWAAAWYLGERYRVLGLPTGTGSRPENFLPALAGRAVTLAFDGDDAGRKAAQRWAASLAAAGCLVRVCALPEGSDVAALGEDAVSHVLDAAPWGEPSAPVEDDTAPDNPAATWTPDEWAAHDAHQEQWAVIADGIDNAPEAPPAPTIERGRRFYWLADLDALPDPEWLLEGWIERDSTAFLYGPSSVGKTFVAIHWSLLLAAQGESVLYVAAEGMRGIKKRVRAWETHYGAAPPRGVIFDDTGTDMRQPDDFFLSMVETVGPSMIVIDTLARNIGDGDENATKDMSAFVKGLDRVRQSCGAAMVVVHHTGKDGTRGMRGSSAAFASAETVVKVGKRRLDCEKQKNAEAPPAYGYRLDRSGDSLCLVAAPAPPAGMDALQATVDSVQEWKASPAWLYVRDLASGTKFRSSDLEDRFHLSPDDAREVCSLMDLDGLIKRGTRSGHSRI